MLSIGQCKKILNSEGRKYSETDIPKIRSFLSMLVRIEIEIHSKQKQ
jgi:hypothetical protein